MLENNMCQLLVFDFDNHAKGAEQDVLPVGGLGNVIALPLQGLALKSGNSAFVDENWNAYEEQLQVLNRVKRLTKQDIEDILSLWNNDRDIGKDSDDSPWDSDLDFDVKDIHNEVKIIRPNRIYIDSTGM